MKFAAQFAWAAASGLRYEEEKMKKLIRRSRGFTLIELLVVVLILAILMAVALPMYLSAVADSERKTCRANMQTIANAVRAWQVKNRNTTSLPTLAALQPDLQNNPVCPVTPATAYTITGTAPAYTITCAGTSAHGTFSPGDSS